DGIRDDLVTGVQTCALPISGQLRGGAAAEAGPPARRVLLLIDSVHQPGPSWTTGTEAVARGWESLDMPMGRTEAPRSSRRPGLRSEGRRVGKACAYCGCLS